MKDTKTTLSNKEKHQRFYNSLIEELKEFGDLKRVYFSLEESDDRLSVLRDCLFSGREKRTKSVLLSKYACAEAKGACSDCAIKDVAGCCWCESSLFKKILSTLNPDDQKQDIDVLVPLLEKFRDSWC